MLATSVTLRKFASTLASAAIPTGARHRVLIVGGGTAGTTISAQLRRSKAFRQILGDRDSPDDIAIVDPATEHHYQPGWTLIGAGLKPGNSMVDTMSNVIPKGVKHYRQAVAKFDPHNNAVFTQEGHRIAYDYLVVAPGLAVNFDGIQGLPDALADPQSGVSTIYSLPGAQKTWHNISSLKSGNAVFTQPAGIVKCAGAPQKIMWMAASEWRRRGTRDNIDIAFATGGAAMFSVPKYAEALNKLRLDRNIQGLFQTNLVAIDTRARMATFEALQHNGKQIHRPYDLLHVTPPQRAHEFVAASPLADPDTGFVKVRSDTLQHTEFANIFSLGDSAGLPTSKTAAAISSQAPVLVDNLLAVMRKETPISIYQGYSSCPLLTGHGELMLCEFKYGGVPAETFAPFLGSQHKPRRLFYHLKKDIFPPVYWRSFLKGSWFGASGIFRPRSVTLPNASQQAQPATAK